MNYNVSEGFLTQLSDDLNKRYLSDGLRLGGEIKENKIKLFTEDRRGKHSNFTTRVFKAELNGNKLSGKFCVSIYVIILLLILFAVCVESIVAAIITGGYLHVIFPALIIVIELIYLFSIKSLSAENDKLIVNYLEDCSVDD